MKFYRLLILFGSMFVSNLIQTIDIKAMIEGMGSSFGIPPAGYIYNFEVFNDAHVTMYLEQEQILSFMGAFMQGPNQFYIKKTIPSIFDTAGAIAKVALSNQNYYFNLYIGQERVTHKSPTYKESLTQLPLAKNDPKVYYYHIYTGTLYSKGSIIHSPKVEVMGWQDPNKLHDSDVLKKGNVAFSGQLSNINFVNNSAVDVQISLTYDKNPYTFTVEHYSYNSLNLPTPLPKKDGSSTQNGSGTTDVTALTDDKKKINNDEISTDKIVPLFSLRPNTITFSQYNSANKKYESFKSLQLPAQGFDGTAYTIEIFQDKDQPLNVCIQGFQSGNYDIAVTPRYRDITPCICTFWYESFKQAGSVEGYIDLPGQVWIVYAGKDNPMQAKVTASQVVSWQLTRPLIEQGDQYIYFLYINTTDDVVAGKFIDKFISGSLGVQAKNVYQTSIMQSLKNTTSSNLNQDLKGQTAQLDTVVVKPIDQVAAAMGALPVHAGIIEDHEQNIQGYLIGADVFSPAGLGFSRFYYTLSPSVLSTTPLVSYMLNYLDSSKTKTLGASQSAIKAALQTTVDGWLVKYRADTSSVEKNVEQYLIKYGNSAVVSQSGVLTPFGSKIKESIISGNVSLRYPSMKLSTVTNRYVYDFGKSAPDKMPENIVQLASGIHKKI